MALRVSKNKITLENIPLHLSRSISIASSANVDLSLSSGNMIHITGSTGPITSFGVVPAGATFVLIFDATPTINFNAISMILNTGGANYTCQAGDRAIILSEGGGNWVITFIKKDGTSTISSSSSSSSSSSGGIISITTSRALASTDDGKTLAINASSDITLTVPSTLSTAFGCAIYQASTGAAIFSASGVTITPATSGNTKTGGVGKMVTLIQTGTNTYSLSGGTA